MSDPPTCNRPGCFNRTMIPVPGMAADLYECPLCGAMADTAPVIDAAGVVATGDNHGD